MKKTPNQSFSKPEQSDKMSVWLDAFNSNMDKMDGMMLPLPAESGGSGTGGTGGLNYAKYSNGVYMMWGAIHHGTQYPCTREWAGAAGYASDDFDVWFPVPLADSNFCFIPHVSTFTNPDTWCVTRARDTTHVNCSYLCAINDSANVNDKTLNVFIMGRWK